MTTPSKITTSAVSRVRRLLLAGLVGVSACAVVTGAAAQAYPNKPIRLIVPYPPGGGTDIVSRLVASKMSVSLGQPIIIENKPGASTIIGTEMLARSAPDGYTIGLITDSHAINQVFFPKLPYDTLKDFETVSQLVSVPLVLVAHPSLNVKNVPELIALAKARQGKLNYASIGDGSPHHLSMEWLKSLAGIQMAHIPYKGVAPALNDLVGGQVDLMFTGTSSAEQFVKNGRLNALAVSSAKRQPSFPDTPSVAEQGLSAFDVTTYYAIVAPAGVPREIITRLNQEIAAALALPDVKARLATLGNVGTPSSPMEASTFIGRSVTQWSNIIKTADVKIKPAN